MIRYAFWEMLLNNFRCIPVIHYVSFLHNYFEEVSSEGWPRKMKFSNFYLFTSLNYQKPSNVQKKSLMNGGEPSDLLLGSKQFAVFDI